MPVRLSDLVNAFLVAGPEHYGEEAYIHLVTGEIFIISEAGGIREGPEDMTMSEEFVAVPSERELRLGRDLALSFVDKEAPGQLKLVNDMFRRKGAYRRFKQWLHERGKLNAWYAFVNEATKEALRGWCEENEIEIIDD